MKRLLKTALTLTLLFTIISCAALTRHKPEAIRDEFLFKLPMLNEQILGELKYENPDLDLRTLQIKDYASLFELIDTAPEDKKIIKIIKANTTEQKLTILEKTFIICLRSQKYAFVMCDDASTPNVDKVKTKEPLPEINSSTNILPDLLTYSRQLVETSPLAFSS